MLGTKLKNPCPFCGGPLSTEMHLYKSGGVYAPHLEAECRICRTHIVWPGSTKATLKDLFIIAEHRAPCRSECAQEAAATVAAWKSSSKRKEERP